MAKPTLQDEYRMLFDELRQNRQIQLQAFFATPIWVSLFFGLVASNKGTLAAVPLLVLVPIPLIFLNLLLVANRRRSSDLIVTYIRVAFDQGKAQKPGWHMRLHDFREELKNASPSLIRFPQRFDFNMVVWFTYFSIALICIGTFYVLDPHRWFIFWLVFIVTVAAFIVVVWWNLRISALKSKMITAWEKVFANENQPANSDADAQPTSVNC